MQSNHSRLMGTAFGAVLIAAIGQPAYAQPPFRIARPIDGASVRETVRIQIPRAALNSASYLQVAIDDRFRFGLAVPPAGKAVKTKMIEGNNQMVTVLWDTKGSVTKAATVGESDADKEKREELSTAVEDGTHTIELTVHDAGGRRIGRQTLTVNVANRGGLQMPTAGILMSYRHNVGEEARYDQLTNVKYIGDRPAGAQGANFNRPGPGGGFGGGNPFQGGGFGGGNPFQGGGGFAGGPPSFGGGGNPFGGGGNPFGGRGGGRGGRFNRGGGGFGGGNPFQGGGFGGGNPFGGGFGGGGFAPQQPSGPFSLDVQNVRATFESTPEDIAGEGTYFIRDKVVDGTIIAGNGNAALLNSVYNFKSRYRVLTPTGFIVDQGVANVSKPGAYVALQLPNLGGGYRRINQTWNAVTPVILEWATMDKPAMVNATNRLVGLEWQDGYQTARIEQTYNGSADIPIFGGAGEMRNASVKLDRTIWFAYKAGKVIRCETVVEVDGQGPSNLIAAMVPGAGVGGGVPGGFAGGGNPFGGGGNPFAGGGNPFGGGAPFGGGGGLRGGRGGGGGGEEDGGAGFGLAGLGNGGFGGLQQQQEAPPAPAKFRSISTITLARLRSASQLAAQDRFIVVRDASVRSRRARAHEKCVPAKRKFVKKKA